MIGLGHNCHVAWLTNDSVLGKDKMLNLRLQVAMKSTCRTKLWHNLHQQWGRPLAFTFLVRILPSPLLCLVQITAPKTTVWPMPCNLDCAIQHARVLRCIHQTKRQISLTWGLDMQRALYHRYMDGCRQLWGSHESVQASGDRLPVNDPLFWRMRW